jgi:hypothetical protein
MTTEQRPFTQPRAATAVRQSRMLGWLLRVGGWVALGGGSVLGVLAYQSFGRVLFPPVPRYAAPFWLRLLILLGELLLMVVLLFTGRWAIRRSRRHLAVVLHSLEWLAADQPVVLFLRSFADDAGFAHQQRGKDKPWEATTRTEEEQLAHAVAPFGRLVALGRPGDPIPQAGAARHYASDHDWQANVLAGLDRAGLVLLACGQGPSLRWEVEQLRVRDQPERLVLLITRDADQYMSFAEAMRELFPHGLPEYSPRPLPARAPGDPYVRAAIWFDADWTPHLEHLDGRREELVREQFLVSAKQWIRTAFPLAIWPVFQRAGLLWPGLETVPEHRPWQVSAAAAVFLPCWAAAVQRALTSLGFHDPVATSIVASIAIGIPALVAYRVWRGGYLARLYLAVGAGVAAALLLLFGALPARGDLVRITVCVLAATGLAATFFLLKRKDVAAWFVDRQLDRLYTRRTATPVKQPAPPRPVSPSRRRAWRRARWITLVVLLVPAGIGLYWLIAVPKASDARDVSDLRPACQEGGERRYFPQLDAYTGTGTHPIAIFFFERASGAERAEPDPNQPEYWNGLNLNAMRVQLIACLSRSNGADGSILVYCELGRAKIPLYRGRYDVTLYEARTGRVVATEHLRGTDDLRCPPPPFDRPTPGALYTKPDLAEYQSVLGRYVER